MDVAGARALAHRIAEGKPEVLTPREGVGQSTARPATAAGVEVVYLRPIAARQPREIRIYVRRPDGHLRRVRL